MDNQGRKALALKGKTKTTNKNGLSSRPFSFDILMNNDLQFTIHITNEQLKDILIATLSDIGFTGFEENESQLIAYVKENDFKKDVFKPLMDQYNVSFSESVVEERNWNEVWESSFQPVLIDDFCLIRAHFHTPLAGVEHEIVITPKMSFGTGHHATTYMMVQQMREIDFSNKTVADFGTGTGILAILAEKLGAAYIWAVDNDDWSIENAKENLERNNCKLVELEKVTSFSSNKRFDIIVANINRNVILDNLTGLVFGLSLNGKLLLSGLLKTDEKDIINMVQMHNLTHVKTVERENWISILFHR